MHRQELCDRIGVAIGNHGLRLLQRTGAMTAIIKRNRIGDGLTQQAPVSVVIRKERLRPESDRILAIGVDRSDIDPVHRCPAHQSDRAHGPSFAARYRTNAYGLP